MDERTTIADLERRLAESEARHRLLIKGWAQAEWETDAEGVVVADSPSWRAYTGQTVEEWRGSGWLDAVHPDDRAHAERQWREAVAARGPVDAEYRLRAPGGGWRWTNVRAAPVLDAEGTIERWLGLNVDIDVRKRADAALRESEEKYRSLFEMMGTGFVINELVRDAEGRAIDVRYLELNPAVEKLVGWTARDTVGRLMSEKIPAAETAKWVADFEAIIGSGASMQSEHYHESLGMWFRANASPIGGDRVALVYQNTTVEKRADLALRESEERQAFLLKLSDALGPVEPPDGIMHLATELLLDRLAANRCAYYEIEGGNYVVRSESAVGVPWFGARYPVEGFGRALLDRHLAGRSPMVVDDVASVHDPDEVEKFAAIHVRAYLNVTLFKQGRFVAGLTVHSREPRAWTATDVALVEETAERTWAAVERARAERDLRESEGRFQQFASASAAGLWISDAATLAMEYASPALATIYGVDAAAILGDIRQWASMIVPDDRDGALGCLEAPRRGETVVHEFRIRRPSDGAFRWIRNTDFPLRDGGRIPRIGGIASDVTEARLAAEHSAVLLAELQHRVRNIMALLRSITDRTAERAESVPDYRDLMMGRLLAFARVQALLTRTANVSVGIASIVHDEVSVQAHHERQYILDGPDVVLSPKAAEVLTLAIHELATNAVKYGALSVPAGRVTVRWSTFERQGGPWLAFDWTEEGARPAPAPGAPRRRGFGSELIEERIPYELRGRGQVAVEPGGARCHLEFPLQAGASVLETGAPQRASVFGGAIDMTGEPDLTGRRVLVVEDDYYLATDAARALRGAGADVMGPCATEADARAALSERRPDAVVVDLNLGSGPSFKLAEALKDLRIPFVFTTGYDAEVIPAEFEGVERLEKPIQLRQVVGAVARLTGAA